MVTLVIFVTLVVFVVCTLLVMCMPPRMIGGAPSTTAGDVPSGAGTIKP
jgi:hypothetical protein